MKTLNNRIATTVAHINSLQFGDYVQSEMLMLLLNAVDEYIPRSIVETYEDKIQFIIPDTTKIHVVEQEIGGMYGRRNISRRNAREDPRLFKRL